MEKIIVNTGRKRKMVKISSKQGNVRVFSSNPSFSYLFQEADVPVEVKESHKKKILRNADFYEFKGKLPKKDKKVHPDGWEQELQAMKGIGKKTVKDLIRVYPNKETLIEDIKNDKKIPVDDDIAEKLKKAYS